MKDVKARPDYTLLIRFEEGELKVYDAMPLLRDKLFHRPRDLGYFLKAKAKYDTVIWDEDLDIAPEHLYERSVPIRQLAE